MAKTLEVIDPAEFVPWEINDPDLVMGPDWVLPTRADVASMRLSHIVTPKVATQLSPELVSEDLLDTDELELAVHKMLGDLGANGVGIAAPQVGEPWKLVGMKMKEAKEKEARLVLLANPVFTPDYDVVKDVGPSGSWLIGGEGCLTLPRAVVSNVRRARAGLIGADFRVIPVQRDNNTVALRAEPWVSRMAVDQPNGPITARIAQHETDHLDGKLFPDRAYADVVDKRMLMGAAFWVHGEQYEAFSTHMAGIRRVLLGHLAIHDLPELPLQVLPQDQYQALRDGRITMPQPRGD